MTAEDSSQFTYPQLIKLLKDNNIDTTRHSYTIETVDPDRSNRPRTETFNCDGDYIALACALRCTALDEDDIVDFFEYHYEVPDEPLPSYDEFYDYVAGADIGGGGPFPILLKNNDTNDVIFEVEW